MSIWLPVLPSIFLAFGQYRYTSCNSPDYHTDTSIRLQLLSWLYYSWRNTSCQLGKRTHHLVQLYHILLCRQLWMRFSTSSVLDVHTCYAWCKRDQQQASSQVSTYSLFLCNYTLSPWQTRGRCALLCTYYRDIWRDTLRSLLLIRTSQSGEGFPMKCD